MENKYIKINDITIEKTTGRSISFEGRHSGKSLAGLDLSFSVWGQESAEKVEDLFTRDIVQIEDPFLNRSYQASLRKKSDSYRVGHPEHRYVAEIRELDMPPEFNTLDIEGHQFPVLKYIETEHGDVIGRHALLKLLKTQFLDLQSLLKLPTVQIKRMGADENPLTVRYGGAMRWSHHEEGEFEYYKQIVRFFPPEYLLRSKAQTTENALIRLVVSLSARFEALLDQLLQNKLLSVEQRDELLGKDWENLVREDRLDEIIWEIERVPDAEEEL